MNIVQAIILGIIQGLTEFIPVSSSGHLYLFPQVLGWATPSTIFITIVDWGTLIALIVYYRKLIFKYLIVISKFISNKKAEFSSVESDYYKTIINIIIATIPAGVIGFLAEKVISKFYDEPGNASLAAIITTLAMIVVGVIFVYSDKFFKNNSLELKNLSPKKALTIGVSQALAFIRGVSRSGITLLTGESLGLKSFDAAEYSFLMSIPIIGISTLYETYQLFSLPKDQFSSELMPAVVASIFAFISGIFAISFLLKYLKNHGLKNFGIYRIIFGIVVLVVLIIK